MTLRRTHRGTCSLSTGGHHVETLKARATILITCLRAFQRYDLYLEAVVHDCLSRKDPSRRASRCIGNVCGSRSPWGPLRDCPCNLCLNPSSRLYLSPHESLLSRRSLHAGLPSEHIFLEAVTALRSLRRSYAAKKSQKGCGTPCMHVCPGNAD